MSRHCTLPCASPAQGTSQHGQIFDTLMMWSAFAGWAIQPASNELASWVYGVYDGRRILLESCTVMTSHDMHQHVNAAACVLEPVPQAIALSAPESSTSLAQLPTMQQTAHAMSVHIVQGYSADQLCHQNCHDSTVVCNRCPASYRHTCCEDHHLGHGG